MLAETNSGRSRTIIVRLRASDQIKIRRRLLFRSYRSGRLLFDGREARARRRKFCERDRRNGTHWQRARLRNARWKQFYLLASSSTVIRLFGIDGINGTVCEQNEKLSESSVPDGPLFSTPGGEIPRNSRKRKARGVQPRPAYK